MIQHGILLSISGEARRSYLASPVNPRARARSLSNERRIDRMIKKESEK